MNRKQIFKLGKAATLGALFLLMGVLFTGWLSYRFLYIPHGHQTLHYIKHTYTNQLKDKSRQWFGEKSLKDANVPKLVISIDNASYEKLRKKADSAIAIGQLIQQPGDYVDATLRYNDQAVDIKLRLKGDNLDHLLEGSKWSLRVKVMNNESIMGCEEFSLQHPRTKGYLHEWLFQQVMKNEGIISLRYQFVEVVINDESLGLYALEEHFDRLMLKNNGRPNGVILRFNEDALWDELQRSSSFDKEKAFKEFRSFTSADVKAFERKSIKKEEELYHQYVEAYKLLTGFQRGDSSASSVFDPDKMGQFYALLDVLGRNHAARWINLRYYYDAVSKRLEPIAFDGNGQQLEFLFIDKFGLQATNTNNFKSVLFSDTTFVRSYMKYLTRFSKPDYMQSVFSKLENELVNQQELLESSFPEFTFSKGEYLNNCHYIEQRLNIPKGLSGELIIQHGEVVLSLAAIQSFPLEINKLTIGKTIEHQFFPLMVLHGKKQAKEITYEKTKIFVSDDALNQLLRGERVFIEYCILGTAKCISQEIMVLSEEIIVE